MNSVPTNKVFAKQIGVTFPLLSDFKRKVTEEYGILNTEQGFAHRTTFVVSKQGIITHIDRGSVALSPNGAGEACSLLAHEQMERRKE